MSYLSFIKKFLNVEAALILLILSRLFNSQIYIVLKPSFFLTIHTMLEFFSIIVSSTIAFQCFASYPYIKSNRRLFLGIIFFSVGIFDLMHTLLYKGMPFLNLALTGQRATDFWVIARATEGIGLILYLLNWIPPKKTSIILSFFYVGIVIFAIIQWGPDLPPLLDPNGGVSVLKVKIEYLISLIYFTAILILTRKSTKNSDGKGMDLIYAVCFILLSEIIFTFYKNVYDTDNFLGHIYKVIGYYYILKSVLMLNVREPFMREYFSEKRFEKVFQTAPVALAIISKSDHRYLEVNECFLKLFNLSCEDIIGKTPVEGGLPKNQWQNILDHMNKENPYVVGKSLHSIEIPVISKKGSTLGYALTSCEPIEFNGQECILFSATNISEIKYLQEEIKKSEELFYKVFSMSPNMISIVRKSDNRFIDVNHLFLSQREFSRENVIGKTPFELGYPENEYLQMLNILNKEGRIENYEMMLVTENGLNGSILVSAETVTLNNEVCIIFSSTDITELKRLKNEMTRLDCLNLVGQMAAGVGHEIRNPMTTVRGYLQLLELKLENAGQKPIIKLMIDELDRANSIITEFLSLARTKKTTFQCLNLNDILKSVYPLIEADTFTQNKQIRFTPGEIPALDLNAKEITQLVLNLCRNGLEAMKARGCLSIETYLWNNHVVLSIKDEGSGIPPEALNELGTPFFTTKENGTGLGLPICYRIAQSHNARIDVRSNSNGTTFFVYFPVSSNCSII